LQNLHTGEVVRARGRTWRVTDVRPFDGCRRVDLSGIADGASCQLLAPFDQIDRVAPLSDVPRRVGIARWRRAARALIARGGAPGLLQQSAAADIEILPHQIEPVVAVLRGAGCRVLLADEVGLGKTIEACLLVAELRARAFADRVLILTPPGLRDQWKGELTRRFHVDAVVADARTLRRRIAEIPPDLNPWTTWQTVIASIDYAKRPEILRPLLESRWDIVIVDEAHRVANDGDRREAAAAVTSRAAYVVLLTATPHSGDDVQFQSLCGLGAHGDRLLIFRRTRTSIAASAKRRLHRLHVRSTPDERRMRTRLDAFARAVESERGDADRDTWIALALLRKRAYSSARALELSVTRRLDALAGIEPPEAQLRLPLDDEGELSEADESPAWQAALGLEDVSRERRLLSALADAAGQCVRHESKIAAIRRLLRRVREPVIIFTEYRDTLQHLAREIDEPSVALHGGMTAAERAAALGTFRSRRTRILLATDAAAEGLNLHHVCRTVVNLELPWNPMRLEQRIGRVDRIGQKKTVHAFHVVGRETGELGLLDDLRRRIAHAQSAIGAPDPLDGALAVHDPASLPSDHADVDAELRRLRLARLLQTPCADDVRPLVARASNRRTRQRLSGRTLALCESVIQDARDRIVASRSVAIACTGRDRDMSAAGAMACAENPDWQLNTSQVVRQFCQTAIDRCEAVARAIANDRSSPSQPGLFDRRAHFAHAALQAAHQSALSAQQERATELRLAAEISVRPSQLRLVLLPR